MTGQSGNAAKRQESWRWPLLVRWAMYWDIVLPFTRRVWCLDIGYRGQTALASLGWRYKR